MKNKKQTIILIPFMFICLGGIFYSGIKIGETRENARWFVGPYSDHLFDKDKELMDLVEKLEENGTEKERTSKLREVAREIKVANKIMKERN